MADLFGISNAVRGVVEVYFRGARQSGRTSLLLDSVRAGDVVVFLSADQAKSFERLCRDRRITGVEAISIPPEHPEKIFERPSAVGRIIWDHCWLEAHYAQSIEHTSRRLLHIGTQASGFGEVHFQTQLAARERARWLP
jgi:hypothetical protein